MTKIVPATHYVVIPRHHDVMPSNQHVDKWQRAQGPGVVVGRGYAMSIAVKLILVTVVGIFVKIIEMPQRVKRDLRNAEKAFPRANFARKGSKMLKKVQKALENHKEALGFNKIKKEVAWVS